MFCANFVERETTLLQNWNFLLQNWIVPTDWPGSACASGLCIVFYETFEQEEVQQKECFHALSHSTCLCRSSNDSLPWQNQFQLSRPGEKFSLFGSSIDTDHGIHRSSSQVGQNLTNCCSLHVVRYLLLNGCASYTDFTWCCEVRKSQLQTEWWVLYASSQPNAAWF